MVRLMGFLLDHADIEGPVNATAPHPVVYRSFTRAFASALSRPHCLPMPAWLLKLIFGEAAQLLTQGQKVVPAAALAAGFTFRFATIDVALADITGLKK
jgi:NAD dependent epimerase/dehydratase family enzyme